jgi:hypothetical protein
VSLIFTAHYDGHPISVLELRGRVAFLPHELGIAAGYLGDGQRFVDQIVHEWAESLDDDDDIAQLVGKELDALKRDVAIPPNASSALVLFPTGAERCLLRSHARCSRDLIRFLHDDVLSRVIAYNHANTPARGFSAGDDPRLPRVVPLAPKSALQRAMDGEKPKKSLLQEALDRLSAANRKVNDATTRQARYREMIRLASDLREEGLINDEQWAALRVEAVEELLGRSLRASLPPFGLDTVLPPRAA